MIKLLGELPKSVGLAISGGIDSMVALDFLLRGGRDVKLYHFHHGTPHADDALEFVTEISEALEIPLEVGRIGEQPPEGVSKEMFWREARYKFLDSFDNRIVLGHHLDDVVETWLFSTCHGTPKLIPYERGNCFRPFLKVRKSEIVDWATKNNVIYIQDPSNENTDFIRNKIRHEIVPRVLEVNPGIHKVLEKKLIERESSLKG